jgi:hypothetical protein
MAHFSVTAVWDEEAKVFYSESDITGLHIEAATLDEFERTMHDLAPAMIVENHVTKADIAAKPLIDLIPSIIFNRPAIDFASAQTG